MSSPSAQPECIMPECHNQPRTRGVCSTHRDHLYVHGSVEVQRAVEEHERQASLAAEMDWDYLDEDQRRAIEMGVRDAYWENSDLQECDLENMLQEAWIRAAGHKAEVQKIKTFTMLRQQAKRWAVEANVTAWTADRQMDYFEDLLPRNEED